MNLVLTVSFQKKENKMNMDDNNDFLLNQLKISRRRFLSGAAVLGASLAFSPLLPHGRAIAGTDPIPKRGGRFRMGMAGGHTTDSLNPALLADQVEIHTNYALRNNLVEVDHLGNVIPELAQSWDVSSDASNWTFMLRKDVTFHNGKTMEAEDVISSIRHHMGKDSKSGAKSYLDQIQEIKADGKDKVIFNLKGGNADFPYILNDYHLTIFPSDDTGNNLEKGIGTGGYILKEWEPGVRAFMVRNPNYFKAGRAHFDEVEILVIEDANARTNALKTNQIDYMNRVELKTVHLMKRIKDIEILRVPGGHQYALPMHTDVAPFNNKDLRMALKYGISREELIKQFLRGFGTMGNDHPISPSNKYHDDTIPQRKYDPDKAAFHFKKAGLASNIIPFHSAETAGFLDIATLYKEQLKKAGVNLKIVKEPVDGYWSNVWLKKPFCNCYWGVRPTPDMMFSVAYTSDAKWNDSHFKNNEFDQLVLAARTELDDKKRKEMYSRCQYLIRDEGGTVIPFFKDYVEASNTRVAHGPLSGLWESDSHRACERFWFS